MEGTRTGCAVGSRHGCRPPSRGCLAHCLVADSCHKTSHVSEGSVNYTHPLRPQEGHGYCGMSWKRDGLSFRPHVKSPSHLGPHQQPAGTTVPCLAPRAGRGHGSSIHARRQLCAFSGPVLTRTCISPCSVCITFRLRVPKPCASPRRSKPGPRTSSFGVARWLFAGQTSGPYLDLTSETSHFGNSPGESPHTLWFEKQ